jgi:hypothetical protein
LSLSASPAFGPCGIPFELDPDELDDELEPPPDELEVCAGGLLECVDELELEELEPHAATPKATSTSRAAATRRVVLVIVAFIIAPLCQSWSIPGYDLDALRGGVVPAR